MFRVFSSDERAPGRLGMLAKGLKVAHATALLEEHGMLYYESEVIAIFNLINACRNVIGSKTSVKEDIRAITQIKSDPNYFENDSKRRQIMGLTVAISNKQTVQVSARAYNERGVDLIHRRVLHELLPRYEEDRQF
jgi:hypothetical protein